MDKNLTPKEQEMLTALEMQWSKHLSRNLLLSSHYDGKFRVDNLGINIAPEMTKKLKKPLMMWSRQAVKRVADASIVEGYRFAGDAPEGFMLAMDENKVSDKYDETLPSQGTHGLSFWTTTAGDDNEPPFVISSYDALHATVLWDNRHSTELCGLAILNTDPKDSTKVTAKNFYAPNGDIVEFENLNGKWISRRLKCGTGRCCMTAMRNEPDKQHPLGKSIITPSILQLEKEVNREAVRMILHTELFTAPQRYIAGANEDVMNEEVMKLFLASFLSMPPTNVDGDQVIPEIGQLSQTSMQPHINYIRQLANQFAAEASIPIHSLLYTEANPASAEAIEASRHDLVERVEKLNRLNGQSFRKIAMLGMSILEQKPVAELGEVERSFSVQWRNPLTPTLASSADAAGKLAASVPGFAGTPTFWRMMGYDDKQIEALNAEIDANRARLPQATQANE